MDLSKYKKVSALDDALEIAERRKAHYEDRLTELMKPRRNEAARQVFIDRLAEELNDVMREIAVLHRKIEEARA